MLAIARGFVMGSPGLVAYLEGMLAKRGWNKARLADEAGMNRGTLSNMMGKRGTDPDLQTLNKLSRALERPLSELVAAMGYDPGRYDGHPQAEQIALLIETVPVMGELYDSVIALPPDELRAILAYIEGRRREL